MLNKCILSALSFLQKFMTISKTFDRKTHKSMTNLKLKIPRSLRIENNTLNVVIVVWERQKGKETLEEGVVE